jgi:hypothetical protein
MSDPAIVSMVIVGSIIIGSLVGAFGYWIYKRR